MTSIEDWIPSYPDQFDEDIQYKTRCKREFSEMKALINEAPPKRGEFFNHQNCTDRYHREYDSIMNIQQTGTGKSRTYIATAEFLREQGIFKGCYVLEKGESTKNDFKNQVVYGTAIGRYETATVINSSTSRARKKNITNSVKDWYKVMTYGDFTKSIIENNYTDEQIEKEYSDFSFDLDEGHNLRNAFKGKKRNDDPNTHYKCIWRVFHKAKRIKRTVSTATPNINSVQDFVPLLNLLLPENRQLPISWDYNRVTLKQLEPYFRGIFTFVDSVDTGAVKVYPPEAVSLSNIFTHTISVPEDDLKTDEEFRNLKVDPIPPSRWFEDKADEPKQPDNVKMVEIKVPSKLKLHITTMSVFQTLAYFKSIGSSFKSLQMDEAEDDYKEDEDEESETNEKSRSKFRVSERWASTFVFPDGTWGGSGSNKGDYNKRAGFNRYIPQPIFEGDRIVTSEDFESYLKLEYDEDYEGLKLEDLSSKVYDIIKTELESSGCGYIYTSFKTGSGVIAVGKAFEANGFERFAEKSSVFVTDRKNPKGRRTIRIEKKLRYGIITSGVKQAITQPEIDALLELLQSEENSKDEYVKSVLVTEVGRDGINIFNIKRAHLLNSLWHPAGEHQAMSRFMRALSHEYLLEQERQRIAREEYKRLLEIESKRYTNDEINHDALMDKARLLAQTKARIDVKIYKHAAIPKLILELEDPYDQFMYDVDGNIIYKYLYAIYVNVEEDASNEEFLNAIAALSGGEYFIQDYFGHKLYRADPAMKEYVEDIRSKHNLPRILTRFILNPETGEVASKKFILDIINRGKDATYDEMIELILRLKGSMSAYQYIHYLACQLSIDVMMYLYCEKKDIYNQRILRFMKQCAFDCDIHFERNSKRYLKAGGEAINEDETTSVIDYSSPNYKSFSRLMHPERTEYIDDFSTYDILYSEKSVNIIMDTIIEYLRINGSITTTQIRDLWINDGPKYREKFVIMAIDKLTVDKRMTLNRFGFPSYILTDGYHIFLQRELPLIDEPVNYNMSFYSNLLPCIKSEESSKVFTDVKHDSIVDNEVYSIPDNILNNEVQAKEFIRRTIDNFKNIESKVTFIETAIMNYLLKSNEDKPRIHKIESLIYDVYSFYVTYTNDEPINIIKTFMSMASDSKRNKYINDLVIKRNFDLANNIPRNDNWVVFHCLYDTEKTTNKYGKNKIIEAPLDIEKIRIFKANKGDWKIADNMEKYAYYLMLAKYKYESTYEATRGKYCAFFVNGDFTIKNNTLGSKSKGKCITSWGVLDLIDILWSLYEECSDDQLQDLIGSLGFNPDDVDVNVDLLNRWATKHSFPRSDNDKRLKFFYVVSQRRQDDIKSLVEDEMKNLNRVIYN